MAIASTHQPLAAWYVISLRASGEQARVRRLAQRLGAQVYALSTMRIEALPEPASLRAALSAEIVIVTSPAAVGAVRHNRTLKRHAGQMWLAIGNGTASALLRAGIDCVQTPAQPDSEGLLALSILKSAHGRRIGLITAPGGRDLIAPALRQRGADLLRADVYQRQPLPLPAHRLAGLQSLPATSALLVSSGEALERLWQSLNASQQDATARRLTIASSTRLAALLQQRGFASVVTADGAAPAQLLAALARHVETQNLPVG